MYVNGKVVWVSKLIVYLRGILLYLYLAVFALKQTKIHNHPLNIRFTSVTT